MSTLSTQFSSHGSFSLVERRSLPFYHATGLLYRHQATGLEIFYVACKDPESFASFMFSTPSQDDTGCAHVLEHCILSGSRLYPNKDPFVQISSKSVKTFLNAFTGLDYTAFPFASPLKKDFNNIFSVFSDAVFAPLLTRKAFESEGVKRGSKLSGVVFNEMQGEFSDQDSVLFSSIGRCLFGDSHQGRNSGGDPLRIPYLTYDQFLARYKQWYRPSNCRLLLYGDLDLAYYMDELESKYLSGLSDSQGPCFMKARAGAQNARFLLDGPVSTGDSVLISWDVGSSSDGYNSMIANALSFLMLSDQGCPLYKALLDSMLGEDICESGGFYNHYERGVFSIGLCGARKEDEDKIVSLILSLLQKPLSLEAIKATLHRLDMDIRSQKEDPQGLRILDKLTKTWLRGMSPFMNMDPRKTLKRLEQNLDKDPLLFDRWVKARLVDNPRRAVMTIVSNPGFEPSMHEKLNELARTLGPDTSASTCLNKPLSSRNSFSKANSILLSDLPQKISRLDYDVLDNLVFQPLDTQDMVNLCLYVDNSDISLSELMALPLLQASIFSTDAGKYSSDDVMDNIRVRACNTSLTSSSVLDESRKCRILSKMSMDVPQEDFESFLEFLIYAIRNANFHNRYCLDNALRTQISAFRSAIAESPSYFACSQATSALGKPSYANRELTDGLTQFQWLLDLQKDLDHRLDDLIRDFESLRAKLLDTSRWVLSVAFEKSFSRTIRKALEPFRAQGARRDCSLQASCIARSYLVPSTVAANAASFSMEGLSEAQEVSMSIYSSILNSGKLWDGVRRRTGAYNAGSSFAYLEDVLTLFTSEDPCIKASFACIRDCLGSPVSKTELEEAIIRSAGRELRPQTTRMKAFRAAGRLMLGRSYEIDEKRRQLMLDLKLEDIQASSALCLKAMESASQATLCGSSMARKEGLEAQALEI